MKTKYEIIIEYLEECNKNHFLGANQYTPLIQMKNRELDLFGRDLEPEELACFTEVLNIYIQDYDVPVMKAIVDILKTYERHAPDVNLTITQFLIFLEKEVK